MSKNLTIISLLICILIASNSNAQTKNINPKGKWFFGAEIGNNVVIPTTNKTTPKNHLQGGVLAEYYFARHWSLSAKIKFYKIATSFYQQGSSGWIFSSSTYSGTFNGKVLSAPISVKWEFRIFKNLGGSLKMGTTFNKEFDSIYENYTSNLNPEEYPTEYLGFLSGMWLNYFLDANSAIYFDYNLLSGAKKGEVSTFLGDGLIINSNLIISIGYKINISGKKNKKFN